MDIKLSDIFEEILHKSNPPNVSIMGRIWQAIGWQTKRLELTTKHLILLHTMLDPKFYDWVQPNLEILRSIKPGISADDKTAKPNEMSAKPNEMSAKPNEMSAKPNEMSAKPNEMSAKPNEMSAKPNEMSAKLAQVKSSIKIKVISCPQRGSCANGEMMLNVKFMGYQFVGTFNRNELESDPLKKRKVVYYPCQEEKKDKLNRDEDIIDGFLKEMSYAYLSKTNLSRCDDDIFGLFNATTSQLIAFVDFGDIPRDGQDFSEFIQ